MGRLYYLARLAGRFVFLCTMRAEVMNAQVTDRDGGYILALTHLSHLEPACCSIINRRPIDWMARKEFFRHRPIAWLLRAINAFSVNRQGIPVRSIRLAIQRVRAGRIVGIFPEGGVTVGKQAAIRGGPIKRGCCSVSLRTGVPIIPCVILGTDKLNRVGPWLPFRRARIWVAYGQPIHPPAGKSTRATRAELSNRLSQAFGDLYAQLRNQHGISDALVP